MSSKNVNTVLEAGISLAACLMLHQPRTFQWPQGATTTTTTNYSPFQPLVL